MEDQWVHLEDVTALRLTSKGKGLWCKIEREEICVPLSQIADMSEIQDVGDLGTLIVTKWWWSLPRIGPLAPVENPDNRLVLVSDATGEIIELRKVKCVWCGLINRGKPSRCYHCSRDVRTGELKGVVLTPRFKV